MPDLTSPQPQPPTPEQLAPRPNPLFAEPATVAACQAEYANATEIRRVMDAQDRGERH